MMEYRTVPYRYGTSQQPTQRAGNPLESLGGDHGLAACKRLGEADGERGEGAGGPHHLTHLHLTHPHTFPQLFTPP